MEKIDLRRKVKALRSMLLETERIRAAEEVFCEAGADGPRS